MKEISLDKACALHIGPRESLVRIAEATARGGKNGAGALRDRIRGKEDSACRMLIEKWELLSESNFERSEADCESLMIIPSRHECTYSFSPLGTAAFTSDSVHEWDGVWEDTTLPIWLRVLIEGHYVTQSGVIDLKSGKRLSFGDVHGDLAAVVADMRSGLTLGALGAALCGYTAPNRIQSFLQTFRSDIKDLENIASITVTRSDRFRDDSQAQSEFLFAGSVLYLSAYFQKDTKIEIDLSALSMKRIDTLYFVPPEKAGESAVGAEKYRVSEESESFPVRLGEPNEPTDFVFTRTSAEGVALLDCLSTARVVVVPAEYDGEPVAAIRENGFKKVVAMEKLILPKTVRSIGKNAFDGCKNLKSMAWYGEDTAEGDFMIRDKNRLSFLFTASSEYVIPNDIKSIGNYAFTGCPKLKKITLHKGLSRISSDAFSACKTLKAIALPADWGKLNITALAKAKIKEVILPSGAAVKITDPYLYDFFDVSSGSYVFDYEKAAKHILSASGAGAYKTAEEILTHHLSEIGEGVSDLMAVAVKECIAKQDAEKLETFLSLPAPYHLDFSKMLTLTAASSAAELTAILLRHSGADTASYTEYETPAEPGPELYVKVRFDDNKSFAYFCKFAVEVGDKVAVQGKRAGEVGIIAEIMDERPTGRAAMYTLQVTSASHVVRERLDLTEEL